MYPKGDMLQLDRSASLKYLETSDLVWPRTNWLKRILDRYGTKMGSKPRYEEDTNIVDSTKAVY